MIISKIIVRSGATFNNPVERYANFQTSVTLEAELKEGDNIDYEVRLLQIQADSLSAKHRESLLMCANAKAKLRGEIDDVQVEPDPF